MSVDTMMKELRAVVFGKLCFSFKKNGAFVQFSALMTHQVPRGKNDRQYIKVDKHLTGEQMLIDSVMDEIQLLVLAEKRLEKPKKILPLHFFAVSDCQIWDERNSTREI